MSVDYYLNFTLYYFAGCRRQIMLPSEIMNILEKSGSHGKLREKYLWKNGNKSYY